MRRIAMIGASLAAAMTPAMAAPTIVGPGVRRIEGSRNGRLPWGFVPASINRHTGKPHEHKREIARRLRQQGLSA